MVYLRVSTGDQALGIEAQRTMIADYLAREKIEAIDGAPFLDEDVSGGAPLDKRCGLLAAIAALKRGDVLVVAKRDRLARDPLVAMMAERLAEKRGGRVLCADGNGNGEGAADVLMRRMLDAFAEFERAQIALRTKAALGELRRQGRRISGRPPFGYRFEAGRLVEAPGEAAIMGRARQMQACGMSVGAIVGRLGDNPRTGRAWGRVALWRALRRKA